MASSLHMPSKVKTKTKQLKPWWGIEFALSFYAIFVCILWVSMYFTFSINKVFELHMS